MRRSTMVSKTKPRDPALNPPLLLIQHLVKRFRNPDGAVSPVVDIPLFRMEPGEQLLLQGASGSGKTTFLHLIAGVMVGEEGSIDLGATRLSALNEAARDRLRAREIGYIFQNFNLLRGFSALENVLLAMRFGKGGEPSRARELLRRVGLGKRLDYTPAQLSHGQKQRVAVARALANGPSLYWRTNPQAVWTPKMPARW